MSVIRVLVVDDHPILRAGMCKLLNEADGIEVVGETGDGNEVLTLVSHLQPDVILLDMELPGKSGIEVARELKNEQLEGSILALSAHDDRHYIHGLLANGASGYLVKDEAQVEIVAAVRGVARGEGGWFSRKIQTEVISLSQAGRKPSSGLTNREMDVVRHLVDGKTNMEIGLALGISEKTVEKHMQAIFSKLGVASRTEAAVWAAQRQVNNVPLKSSI